jgi:hypothetical protein
MSIFQRRLRSPETNVDSKMLRLAEATHTAVLEEAKEALENGQAMQRLWLGDGGPTIILEPSRSTSAPLEVAFDTEKLAACCPGRNGMVIEVFSGRQTDIVEEVRELVRAVVGGSYREKVKNKGEKTKVVAYWQGSSGTEQASLNVLRNPAPGAKGWIEVTYDSY